MTALTKLTLALFHELPQDGVDYATNQSGPVESFALAFLAGAVSAYCIARLVGSRPVTVRCRPIAALFARRGESGVRMRTAPKVAA